MRCVKNFFVLLKLRITLSVLYSGKQTPYSLALFVLMHLFVLHATPSKTHFQLPTQMDDPQVADELNVSEQWSIEQEKTEAFK